MSIAAGQRALLRADGTQGNLDLRNRKQEEFKGSSEILQVSCEKLGTATRGTVQHAQMVRPRLATSPNFKKEQYSVMAVSKIERYTPHED